MPAPIDIAGFSSSVAYPSSIFSLEKHENYVYERFAYNIFREGVRALHEKNLPVNLAVKFIPFGKLPAWAINMSVKKSCESNGGFDVEIPELLPPMILLFVKMISPHFEYDQTVCDQTLDAAVQDFANLGSAMVKDYRNFGLATAIRNAFESGGIDFEYLGKNADTFDSVSYLMANHEIAHIYVLQLTNPPASLDDAPAFEHLVDIIATEWQFRRYVMLTPDTKEYLNMRGLSQRSDALYENCAWCMKAHFLLLLLMGFAGAQQSGGIFHFDSGKRHPGGFSRFWITLCWLQNAIAAEISKELGEANSKKIGQYFKRSFDLICSNGLISKKSLWQTVDEEQLKHIDRVADLAEERGIAEVIIGKEFLKSRLANAAAMRPKMK